ncbi:EF-hand domain-containing protein [Wenyingzhuangia sp. 1_MG-2023]|nr:EF-hand domain-containing protein [Wenyingzhuangia sp. 1_MG-2023]
MKYIALKKEVVAVMIAVFGIAGANAQEERGGKHKPPTFAKLLEKMDTNEDGKLSEKETKGPLSKHFSDIDTDEDGFISEKEFENAPKPEKRASKNED